MKKLFLMVLSLAIIFSTASFAQFGVMGGLNLAKFGGEDAAAVADETIEPDYYIRFSAGVFAAITLSDGLALRPELLYAMKGAKYEGLYMGVNGKVWAKLTYIDIPVLVQYTVSTTNGYAPFFLAGPYAGYNLSAKERVEAETLNFDQEEDVKEGIKDFDFGIIFGAGVCINKMFEISARYSMGLTSIDDSPNVDMKNNVIEIRAGIRLLK